VIDYRVEGRRKKRVEIGDARAEGRAFVPDGWRGEVMVYPFGYVSYRTTEPRILADQLRFAKPAQTSAGERMQPPAP
jgi:hypothetical protein